MTDTINLGLPCIEGSQAQKHVTHNDALHILDTLVQLAVFDRDLTAPPGSPAEGQRWIVKATGTGAWAGRDNMIAAWQDGAWLFSAPQTGWLAYVVDEGALLAWTGSAWADAITALTSLNNMTLLGVGTTADTTNPFSVKLNNVLAVAKTVAEGGSGDLRYKLSKESVGNTLSMLFQDNYSGRAEIGLTGDDNLHFKVSANGSTWVDALILDRNTGAVRMIPADSQGFKNIAGRNGGFEVWQRGSNVAVAASTTAYTCDGWYLASGASQASHISRQSGLTGGSQYCARVQRDSGQTGTGTLRFAMPLDIDELKKASGNALQLVFTVATGADWSPASGTLTYNAFFGTGAPAKRNASAYTGESNPISGMINLAQGAAAATVVVPISAAVGGTVSQAEIQFSWVPAGTAGANDWLAIDDLDLRAVAPGVTASVPLFERTDYLWDLTRCQRFLAAYNAESSAPSPIAFGGCGTATNAYPLYFFRVPMRAAITGITATTVSGFYVVDSAANIVTLTSLAFVRGNSTSCVLTAQVASGLTAGANTNLGSQSSSAQILFTGAEI